MTFANQATLSYQNAVTQSNTVTGTVNALVTMAKTASVDFYTPGGQLLYTVTITNASSTPYSNLSLLDNYGRYTVSGLGRFPLSYVDNSAQLQLFINGTMQAGTVNIDVSTDGMIFLFDLPANAIAQLSYGAIPTPYAPLSSSSTITNVATLSGTGPSLPLTAQQTLPVAQNTDLVVSKTMPSGTATVGQPVTFHLQVSNYGNLGIQPTDSFTIFDQLDPYLTNISVSSGGTPWTAGVQYSYRAVTGFFQTNPGALTLSSATYTQDRYGRWITTPSSTDITITGTATGTLAPQSLMEVLPAYTDGTEQFLTVDQVQNDLYNLSATQNVTPQFAILPHPDGALVLLPSSDTRFTLQNNILSVDTTGLSGTISAFIQVAYPGGDFVVQADFVS